MNFLMQKIDHFLGPTLELVLKMKEKIMKKYFL